MEALCRVCGVLYCQSGFVSDNYCSSYCYYTTTTITTASTTTTTTTAAAAAAAAMTEVRFFIL
jgi:hypothetical protein